MINILFVNKFVFQIRLELVSILPYKPSWVGTVPNTVVVFYDFDIDAMYMYLRFGWWWMVEEEERILIKLKNRSRINCILNILFLFK